MNAKPINIAVWGLGGHAFKNVLPALKSSPNTNLIGVYTRNQAEVERAATEYGCQSWSDPETMLNDAQVEAVYVATPIAMHHEHGLMVLRAGKHLLCEKSLTNSYASSIELINLARERELVLCETFMYLYHPQFAEMSRLVSAPAFGQIINTTCTFTLPVLEKPGYRYQKNLGGGAFLDCACYAVSIVLALNPLADIPVVKYSQLRTVKEFEVDTAGTALLQFASGAHAYLSWGYGLAYKNEIGILGESQSVYLNSVFSKRAHQHSSLQLFDQFGKSETIEIEPADSFVGMFSYVQQAIVDSSRRIELLRQAERQAELMQLIRSNPQPA